MKKCGKCKLEKSFSEFCKDKSKKDGLANKCKSCKKLYYNKYKNRYKENYKNNAKEYCDKQLIYYYNNKEERIKYQCNYAKTRYHDDTLFKLIVIARSRIRKICKNKYLIKPSTRKVIGCSLEELKHHIEIQFVEGMNWDNHGLYGWHIDHIIPLSSATNEEELIKLCHYTNLQPLWAKDNLKKGYKII